MAEKRSENPDRENSLEKEMAEKKLRELARAYWLKLHLSPSGKVPDAELEAARETYIRYLDRLENLLILPRQRVTEIIKEVQAEVRQDAETLIKEENALKNSELN